MTKLFSLPSSKLFLRVVLAFDTAFLVVAAIVGSIQRNRLLALFGERELVTWLSAVHLFATAIVLGIMSYKRFRADFSLRSPAFLWLIMSAGFCFLGFDELNKIHETLDYRIHEWLNFQETAWSDRLDDLIVGLYGAFGAGLLYLYRSELSRYAPIYSSLARGFLLLFLMVIFDILTNRGDLLTFALGAQLAPLAGTVLSLLEESFKVLGGGFFLASFYQALRLETLQEQ